MNNNHDDALMHALRTLKDAPVDAAAVHRVRARVMDWADTRAPARRGARFGLHLALGAVALAAVIAMSALAFTMRRVSPPAETSLGNAPAASSVSSVVADNASWRSTVEDSVESIVLDDGTLRLHVKRKPGSRRVIVRVPDGEIEDLGTVFEVVVRDGRTVAVRVDDGQVTVRLTSMSPLTLTAGQSWARAERTAPPRQQRRPDERPEAQSPVTVTPSPPTAPPTPPLLDEDRAYLAIIRAQRAGDTVGAKKHAEDYIESFPNGFRSNEVRRFIRD